MEEIILNKDLKFILKNLNLEQKGKLLELLLEETTEINDNYVENLFTYIKMQQEKIVRKKTKMRTLALLSHATSKIKNTTENSDASTKTCDASTSQPHIETTRKEAKEINNNINKSTNEIKISNKTYTSINLYPHPSLEEVQTYIKNNKFNVDAETFVDFYTSRNWCIGKSEIKNGQATVRMWHRRALENQNTNLTQDESYWHELKEKFEQIPKSNPPTSPPQLIPLADSSFKQLNISSNFSRYMQNIEQNDL